METNNKILKFLTSYKLSFYLFTAGIVYYLFLFAWRMKSPEAVVLKISQTAPFIFLYFIFFINLILCITIRIPVILLKTKRGCYLLNKKITKQGWLKSGGVKGYSEERLKEGILIIRGRLSQYADILFHLMFIFILVGIIFSRFTRFEGRINIPEGHIFWGERGEYITAPEEEQFYRNAPNIAFKVDEVNAEFYEDKLFFTDLYAKLRYPPETGVNEKIIRLKSGVYIGDTHINIEGYGFAPVVLLKDAKQRVLNSATVNLSIFPPTTEDYFLLPDSPYRIYIKFYPDYHIINGKVLPKTMDLVNPLIRVRIFQGKRMVFKDYVHINEDIHLRDAIVSFSEIKRVAQLRIIRDRGIFFIISGLLLGVVGLCWRFLFPRREIFLKKRDNGIELLVSSEFFNELYFRRILRKFNRINL